jgi:polyisoprenoid-binding protein YceI
MKTFVILVVVALVGFGVYKVVVNNLKYKNTMNTQNKHQVDDSFLKEKAKQENTLPEDDTYEKEMARQEMLKVPTGAVKYIVDAKASKIEWSSEKKLIDWKHNGTINIESGVLYKSTNKEKSESVIGYIVVDMDTMTNLDHGGVNETLIRHLKSPDFFDVKTYPLATIQFTASPDPTATMEKGTPWYATGALTMHGKTNPIDFYMGVEESTDGLVISTTSLVIDRSMYEIKFGSESFFKGLGDAVIKNEIPLTITLTAKKS